MSTGWRAYRYVGPAELASTIRPGSLGRRIGSADAFAAWIADQPAEDRAEPFTFVVDADGVLRLAPRRSEHVTCAGGALVLSAGEIGFVETDGRWTVREISNHSTGYCPDVDSWPAVAHALNRASLGHPGGFTHAVVFRRCPGCHEHNIVRDDHFVCVFCDGDLPADWNVDGPESR